jgi:putative Mg2+ transporter-C (MgtC) family protein
MYQSFSILGLGAADLSHSTTLARLGIALGLGAAIGLQREIDGHDAGIRTHALLTLGSALFGLLSVGAFDVFVGPREATNVQVDVTRIASYLVAGVGFLAGGAIIKHSDRVKGLTTAASLWVSAGIGLAAGLGFVFGAVATTVATVFVLLLERPIELLTKSKQSLTVRVVLRSDERIADLVREIEGASNGAGSVGRVEMADGRIELTVSGLAASARERFVAGLEARDDVIGLSYDIS